MRNIPIGALDNQYYLYCIAQDSQEDQLDDCGDEAITEGIVAVGRLLDIGTRILNKMMRQDGERV